MQEPHVVEVKKQMLYAHLYIDDKECHGYNGPDTGVLRMILCETNGTGVRQDERENQYGHRGTWIWC